MEEITGTATSGPRRRRRRADAARSAAAVLDAAVRVLGERPAASLEDVAEAAGVTRQTIYAHYPSRDALVNGVIDHVTAEVVEAMDAADLDHGPAVDALGRYLDAGWQMLERYPLLLHLPSMAPATPQEDHDRHQPIAERLEGLIRRGRHTGEFTRQLPAAWLVTAIIALAHAAAAEVAAGRLRADRGSRVLRASVLRLVATDAPPS